MEILKNLEEKIKSLVLLVQDLKAERDILSAENETLKNKVSQLEVSLSSQKENSQEWDKEKAFAKKAVDDLITDIDSLIANEGR